MKDETQQHAQVNLNVDTRAPLPGSVPTARGLLAWRYTRAEVGALWVATSACFGGCGLRVALLDFGFPIPNLKRQAEDHRGPKARVGRLGVILGVHLTEETQRAGSFPERMLWTSPRNELASSCNDCGNHQSLSNLSFKVSLFPSPCFAFRFASKRCSSSRVRTEDTTSSSRRRQKLKRECVANGASAIFTRRIFKPPAVFPRSKTSVQTCQLKFISQRPAGN